MKRIQAKMHEWYDVKVRGVLGSGKRDVHEIEILGRNLTWTEEGLEYDGSDKNRQALLEGLGLNEESKAVNSAAVIPEEIGQEEDTEMLDASETKRFRSLAATLNYMSSDRSDDSRTDESDFDRFDDLVLPSSEGKTLFVSIASGDEAQDEPRSSRI